MGRKEESRYSLDELSRQVAQWKEHFSFGSFIGFSGELGSGKTTFIRELVSQIGGDSSTVSSPTYVLQHIYKTSSGEIHHWDLYRVGGAPEELYEGRESGALVLIEWPEKDSEFMSELDGLVSIQIVDEETRQITLELFD